MTKRGILIWRQWTWGRKPGGKWFRFYSKWDLRWSEREGIESLPGTLREALAELALDEVVKGVLGSHVYRNFLHAKRVEWEDYRSRIHQWEVDEYLTEF